MQESLQQPEAAQQDLCAALAAFNRSLEIAPNDASIRRRDAAQAWLDARGVAC